MAQQQPAPNEQDQATRTSPTMNDTNNNNDVTGAAVQQVQVQGLPLDWTQVGANNNHDLPVRYPHDVTEIDENDTELCIVGTAGQKITLMGSGFGATVNSHLTQLILRSHMIRKIEGLDKLDNLTLLELYDNQVEALDCLETPGKTLTTLDMSYNVIRDMQPVSLCPHLQELYLANNKLKAISGLDTLTQLRKLDLGANRIRVIEGLDSLVNLEELWMGKNKIETISGLDKLTKLRRLDLQSNRVAKIEHLDAFHMTLEELYLAHNGITTEGAAAGLSTLSFPVLSVVDLSRNRLTSTEPFKNIKSLDELWISGNKIASFDDVVCIKDVHLDTIYLEYNPIQEDPMYRRKIAELLPGLKQIDATMIGSTARTSSVPMDVDLRALQERVIQRAQKETASSETQQQSSSDA